MLLYEVCGERYASPLSNLREVLDIPTDQPDADGLVVLQGQTVMVVPLGAVLGLEDLPRAAPADRTGALLVVEVSPEEPAGSAGAGLPSQLVRQPGRPSDRRWVGLRVDGVLGMIRVGAIHTIEGGITALPGGALAGAFLHPRESGGAAAGPGEGNTGSDERRTEVGTRPAQRRK